MKITSLSPLPLFSIKNGNGRICDRLDVMVFDESGQLVRPEVSAKLLADIGEEQSRLRIVSGASAITPERAAVIAPDRNHMEFGSPRYLQCCDLSRQLLFGEMLQQAASLVCAQIATDRPREPYRTPSPSVMSATVSRTSRPNGRAARGLVQ